LVLLQASRQLAAFVAGIGYYRILGNSAFNPSKQQSAGTTIGCTSWRDTIGNR
jgi:hypothetical protein